MKAGMSKAKARFALVGVLALALSVTAGLAVTADAAKKKKKKTPSVAKLTKAVNAAVPDDVAGDGPHPALLSTQTISKKFKGKVVGDVNVTFRTTGDAVGSANDLKVRISAPNGRTVQLYNGIGGSIASIGPLTLDDDTRTLMCNDDVLSCEDPDATLLQPFAGRAAGDEEGYVELARLNGVPMRGNWTLTVFDDGNGAGQTSSLNEWTLEVRAAKPVLP